MSELHRDPELDQPIAELSQASGEAGEIAPPGEDEEVPPPWEAQPLDDPEATLHRLDDRALDDRETPDAGTPPRHRVDSDHPGGADRRHQPASPRACCRTVSCIGFCTWRSSTFT